MNVLPDQRLYLRKLLLVLLHESGVDLDLSGCEGRRSNELEGGVAVETS